MKILNEKINLLQNEIKEKEQKLNQLIENDSKTSKELEEKLNERESRIQRLEDELKNVFEENSNLKQSLEKIEKDFLSNKVS